MVNEYEYGYIRISKKDLDLPCVKKLAYLAVYVFLFRRACFKDGVKVDFKGGTISLKAGQLTVGRNQISKELNLPSSTVRKILKRFEKEQLIEQQPSNKTTLITLKNWIRKTEKEQQREQQDDNNGTLNKKEKNEKNKYSEEEKKILKTFSKWLSEMGGIQRPENYAKWLLDKYGAKILRKASESCTSKSGLIEFCELHKQRENGTT